MGKGYEEFTIGLDKSSAPSIDRIDSNENYELGNCQWISQGENSNKDSKIALVQLTVDGKLIARFTDAYHAARTAVGYNGKNVIAEKVNAVMLGKRNTHAGCVWQREDVYTGSEAANKDWMVHVDTPHVIEAPRPTTGRVIVQLNMNMEVIAEFNNHVEAGLTVGLQRDRCNRINEVCKGTRNMCGGFRWKYKDEIATSDNSVLYQLWDTTIRADCSSQWKNYDKFETDIGNGDKLVKINTNKAWGVSNFKWVADDYIKNDTSARKVRQLTNTIRIEDSVLIAEYDTTIAAEVATGVTNANIRAVCTGKRKSAGGFRWEYTE